MLIAVISIIVIITNNVMLPKSNAFVIVFAQSTPTEANATFASWIETNQTFDLDEVYNKIKEMQNLASDPVKTNDYVEAVLKIRNFYDAYHEDRWDRVFVDIYVRVYKDGLIIAWIPGDWPEDELPLMLYILKNGNNIKVIPATMKALFDVCQKLGVAIEDPNIVKHTMPKYPNAKKLIVLWPEKEDSEWHAKYKISQRMNVIVAGWLALYRIRGYGYVIQLQINNSRLVDYSGSSDYWYDFARYYYKALPQDLRRSGFYKVYAKGSPGWVFFYLYFVVGD